MLLKRRRRDSVRLGIGRGSSLGGGGRLAVGGGLAPGGSSAAVGGGGAVGGAGSGTGRGTRSGTRSLQRAGGQQDLQSWMDVMAAGLAWVMLQGGALGMQALACSISAACRATTSRAELTERALSMTWMTAAQAGMSACGTSEGAQGGQASIGGAPQDGLARTARHAEQSSQTCCWEQQQLSCYSRLDDLGLGGVLQGGHKGDAAAGLVHLRVW